MNISKATRKYERWLGEQLELVPRDLKLKHQKMADSVFEFLRATFYRWAQVWPKVCDASARAPAVMAVGDLHIENFGTWRDAEGRLVWGINDFDECFPLAYTNDLVRLATSAYLAIDESRLAIASKEAAQALLGGYRNGLRQEGKPFVLADTPTALREMVRFRLGDPDKFWRHLERQPRAKKLSRKAAKTLIDSLPQRGLPMRVVHRIAGLGSLGRQRYVALAQWRGAKVAREIKATAPSACVWAGKVRNCPKNVVARLLKQAVRCPDPFLSVTDHWVVRRLSPDCSRIELSELPRRRDERHLLWAMGFETANIHLASGRRAEVLHDLASRNKDWLPTATEKMVRAVRHDWKQWKELA
jgi:hypothetical protein